MLRRLPPLPPVASRKQQPPSIYHQVSQSKRVTSLSTSSTGGDRVTEEESNCHNKKGISKFYLGDPKLLYFPSEHERRSSSDSPPSVPLHDQIPPAHLPRFLFLIFLECAGICSSVIPALQKIVEATFEKSIENRNLFCKVVRLTLVTNPQN